MYWMNEIVCVVMLVQHQQHPSIRYRVVVFFWLVSWLADASHRTVLPTPFVHRHFLVNPMNARKRGREGESKRASAINDQRINQFRMFEAIDCANKEMNPNTRSNGRKNTQFYQFRHVPLIATHSIKTITNVSQVIIFVSIDPIGRIPKLIRLLL